MSKLNHRQVLNRCRNAIKLALKQYDLGDYVLKFIKHGENATYKVTSGKGVFVARLHLAEGRDGTAILQELEWLNSLAVHQYSVQSPLANMSGEFITEVMLDDRNYVVTLLSWQYGMMRFDSITKHHFYQLGAYMAGLHDFALEHKDTIKHDKRVDWAADSLVGDPSLFGSYELLKDYYTINYEQFHRVRKYLYERIQSHEKAYPKLWGMIHSDFHFGNVLWKKDGIYPIDFDDCGYGCFLYDIAIPIYNEEGADFEQYSAALFDGYSSIRPLNNQDIAMIHDFIMARHITMVSWLLTKLDHPRIGKHFINQLPKIAARLEAYEKANMNG